MFEVSLPPFAQGFGSVQRIRNRAWLLLVTGQCLKNNESHSSCSLKIGKAKVHSDLVAFSK